MPQERLVPAWLDRAAAISWRILPVGLVGWGLFHVASNLFLVVVPAFVGLLLAALLVPLVGGLERRGLRRGVAAGLTLGLAVVVLGGLLALVVWRFVAQSSVAMGQVEDIRRTLIEWVAASPLDLTEAEIRHELAQLGTRIRENIGTIASGAIGGTRVLLEVISGALLALVLTFFFLRDGDGMADWLVALTVREPHRHRARASIHEAFGTLSDYIKGVVIIGAFDATGVVLGMWLLGLPLLLPIWFLVFLGAFFPVVGAFVAGLAAVVVGLVVEGVATGLIVLAIVVGVEQIEGNILQPAVMGRQVPLHPAVVLLALTAGAVLGGIAGAALAVPVAAAFSAAGHVLRTHTG